jgi:phosphoserine phosphatase RsbU/P
VQAPVAADDLVGALIAAVLMTFGASAFALGRLRRGRDPALNTFAAFSALYGARLLLDSDAAAVFQIPDRVRDYIVAWITYGILVPAMMFVEQVVGGPGWKSSIRRVWQAQLAFTAAAIALDVARRQPGSALWLNPALVLLFAAVTTVHLYAARATLRRSEFRLALAGAAVFVVFALHETFMPDSPLTGGVDLEPIGMLVFVGGLGHFAAQRALSNERRLAALSSEMETAREIQRSIVPGTMPALAGVRVAARYLPASSVAGDFYDFLPAGGGLGVFIADVTGHGVAAALIASMLKTGLAAQEEHADDPAYVLTGLNRLLSGKFDRSFVTATYALVDATTRRFVYANAGHPAPLLWRGGTLAALDHRDLLLGFLADASYTNADASLRPGDRIVLYTDGIAEATNPAGEYFGDAMFGRSIEQSNGLDVEACADRVLAELAAWTDDQPVADDVTLVVVDIV